MQCSNCHCEMRIVRSSYEAQPVEQEDGTMSAEAFQVLEYACLAQQCPEYKRVQHKERIRLTN